MPASAGNMTTPVSISRRSPLRFIGRWFLRPVTQYIFKRNILRETYSGEGVFQRRMCDFAEPNRPLSFFGYPFPDIDWLLRCSPSANRYKLAAISFHFEQAMH